MFSRFFQSSPEPLPELHAIGASTDAPVLPRSPFESELPRAASAAELVRRIAEPDTAAVCLPTILTVEDIAVISEFSQHARMARYEYGGARTERSVRTIANGIAEHLVEAGFPEGETLVRWTRVMAESFDLYLEVSGANSARGILEIQEPRPEGATLFHIDDNRYHLLTTFAGETTQWTPRNNVDWDKPNARKGIFEALDPNLVFSAPLGEILVFKGMYASANGFVHRPPVSHGRRMYHHVIG